jgi:hypothetical protein
LAVVHADGEGKIRQESLNVESKIENNFLAKRDCRWVTGGGGGRWGMLVIGVRGSGAMKRANEIFDAMNHPKNVKHQPKLFLSLDNFYLGLQSRLVNRYNVVAT